MSDNDTKALTTLAKEWVNILSVTPFSYDSFDYFAVAIEYTVPPDPSFAQSQYKTATRWVKYVMVLPADVVMSHTLLVEAVLDLVRGVRGALKYGRN